jgi:SNF2 family N-terminal domain.
LHTDNKNIDLKADIILTTYDMTKKYLMELKQIPFKALILDESHYVKGKKTQRFNAISEIAKDKEITVLISATPLDRPSDLIAQLEIMGTFKPLFHSQKYYIDEYCEGNITGASNVSELKDILRANCMIARDKKEIMPELPDTTRIPFTVPLSERYAELYSKTLDDISEWYYEKSRNNLISQIVDGNLTPAQLMAIEAQAVKNAGRKPSIQAEALVRLNALRQISGIGKLETIKEWIDNFKETGEKLVIFVYHKPVMAKLLSLYPPPLLSTAVCRQRIKVNRYLNFGTIKALNLSFVPLKHLAVY